MRLMGNAPWTEPNFVRQTQVLLDSFEYWLKRPLTERGGNRQEQSRRLFFAPFVVVSHGTGSDPVFNYANQAAIELFEMDLDMFLQTPSRRSAQPVHRDERRQMLERAQQFGFIDDYRGVRISRGGRRFLIEQAVIWNLREPDGRKLGQAAMFSDWTVLER